MAGKNLEVYPVISSGSMSGSLTSSITCIKRMDNIGLVLVATGTPEGTVIVECSSDFRTNSDGTDGSVINAGSWFPLNVLDTTGASPAFSGAAKTIGIDLNQIPFPFIRVRYVRSSGTGTLNAYISAKSI